MKIATVQGRAALVLGDEVADVATASDGRFGPDPMRLYDDWDAFAGFASTVTSGTGPLVEADLGSEDAAFVVEQAEGHELQWYATQEIGPLLELG